MPLKFHYLLEAKFYRKYIGTTLDYLANNIDVNDYITHYRKEFSNDNPIIARENVFAHYQSIIDVLYDGINKTYTTDEQARIDLQKYFNSGNDIELFGSSANPTKIGSDIFNGINIYLVIDKPVTKGLKQGDKFLIHGINYTDYPDRVDEEIVASIKGLIKECECYELCSYSTGNYFSFVNFDKIGGSVDLVLKTPMDFDIFMNKFEGVDLLCK
jgi:hypothetical protein